MIRLFFLELTRLRWRRAVLLLLAVCVLVPLVVLGTHAWSTRPVSDADLADAQSQLDRDLQDPGYQRQIERCERNPERYGAAEATECAEMMGPQLDWYLYRPELDVADTRDQQGLAVFVLVAGLLMLAATTYVGADWNSGSMSNQLLFEPRRTRIWLAKGGRGRGPRGALDGAGPRPLLGRGLRARDHARPRGPTRGGARHRVDVAASGRPGRRRGPRGLRASPCCSAARCSPSGRCSRSSPARRWCSPAWASASAGCPTPTWSRSSTTARATTARCRSPATRGDHPRA